MNESYLRNKRIIPVVLATDENYVSQTGVVIISILENASADDVYNFYILIPGHINKTVTDKIYAITKKYNNANIEYINMKKAFQNIKTTIDHITTPTYYRLNVPSLFPLHDKIIYLDSDVIVEGNLAEYYSIDIKDFYVAGVKAAGTHLRRTTTEGLPSLDQYINAGVLLLNLKLLRKNNVEEEFLRKALKGYKAQDQDVINSACYGHIKHLELKYNCMVSYEYKFQLDELKKVFSESEINEARSNPFIIHYVNKEKPWKSLRCPFADRWWKYAKLLPFFESFLLDNFQSLLDSGQIARFERIDHKNLMRQFKNSEQKLVAVMKRINETEKELKASLAREALLKSSVSFRTGRAITWFPRKIRGVCAALRSMVLLIQ